MRQPASASCIPGTKKEIILSARHCSLSGPVPPWGFVVEPWEPLLPPAGEKVGGSETGDISLLDQVLPPLISPLAPAL